MPPAALSYSSRHGSSPCTSAVLFTLLMRKCGPVTQYCVPPFLLLPQFEPTREGFLNFMVESKVG